MTPVTRCNFTLSRYLATHANLVCSAGSDICQISTSGGTELCGNFVTGTQCLPVYAGENQVRQLRKLDRQKWLIKQR